MLAYLKGLLEYCKDERIIIEVSGVGYSVLVSAATLASLPPLGSSVKIYTYMNVKEDGISLYGFASMEELDLFHKLITVSGVGPKAALGFLSVMPPQNIIMAILSGDEKALGKAPGVGKKTAQRVILELRDKFKTEDAVSGGVSFASEGTGNPMPGDPKMEAVEALMSLGYSRSEGAAAVSKVYQNGMQTETILKKALVSLVKF